MSVLAQQTTYNGAYDFPTSESIGQAFIAGAAVTGKKVTSVSFWLVRSGTPGGTGVAKIYAATGTPGTDGKPTGSALAVSGSINLNDISNIPGVVSLTFSGADQITLVNGTSYCVQWEPSVAGGTGVYYNSSNIDSNQNFDYGTPPSWTPDNTGDVYFLLYGIDVAVVSSSGMMLLF